MCAIPPRRSHFFFNDTATTEIYTLSLHDALPISECECRHHREGEARLHAQAADGVPEVLGQRVEDHVHLTLDWKSTRLNSSHANISYAVFCLKKKNKNKLHSIMTLYARTI